MRRLSSHGRRWAVVGGLAAALSLSAQATAAAPRILVEGEAPAQANIRQTAQDARVSGGAYLALETDRAPGARGWYATYRVSVPQAGVYDLDVFGTPAVDDIFTAEQPAVGASHFDLSLNGGPFKQVSTWRLGESVTDQIYLQRLDDVELQRGLNTITYRVNEPRVLPAPALYRFFLDAFALTPTDVALARAYVGDPDSNLGTYRAGEPATLRFALNGRALRAQSVAYRIVDYFGTEVASGTATVPAGARTAGVALPELPPGNYRAEGWLPSAADDKVIGNFARLPTMTPATGASNRFGLDATAAWGLPSAKLEAFAAAMRQLGVGYVKDRLSWPVVEPRRGSYDTSWNDKFARAFRDHGVKVMTNWDAAPEWAVSPTSAPLPADLRDAYRFANHLARQQDGAGGDALELWNEPDTKRDHSTGDQHAAYIKAAALGIQDVPDHPLAVMTPTVLPPSRNDFKRLMLENDILPYLDVWAFHGYIPGNFAAENELRRSYGSDLPLWMTETGLDSEVALDGPGCWTRCIANSPTPEQQADQARSLVQQTVEDLAAGTDKHFWFIGIPFQQPLGGEGAGYFGILNTQFQPLPAYSAHTAMASILGRADFVTRVEGLPDGASGYVFANGRKSVTVLWAAEPTAVQLPARDGLEVYDIMGARHAAAVEDGKVALTLTPDPLYVVADAGRALAAQRVTPRGHSGELSEARHVVLGQRYSADNLAPEQELPPDASTPTGYLLDPTTEMWVDVYNFARQEQRVTVVGHVGGGWSLDRAEREVVVPPMGRVGVRFTVSARAGAAPGVDYSLSFGGFTPAGAISPSVARIQLKPAAG
jgi:hypothetical protein